MYLVGGGGRSCCVVCVWGGSCCVCVVGGSCCGCVGGCCYGDIVSIAVCCEVGRMYFLYG